MRTVVLVGGGHAHVQVLISSLPWSEDVRRVLVSDGPVAIYSGMLPSIISGLIPAVNAEIDLARLAARNGWEYINGRVTAISGLKRTITIETSEDPAGAERCLPYSILSVDVGAASKPFMSRPVLDSAAQSRVIVESTRPIEKLLGKLESFEVDRVGKSTVKVVIVGGGAAGVELALNIDTRFRTTLPGSKIAMVIVDGSKNLSARLGPAASLVLAELHSRNIEPLLGSKAWGIEGDSLVLDNGQRIPADLIVAATGAAAHEWLSQDTDLGTDAAGFLSVKPNLCSVKFPNVLAAGDCCSFNGYFGKSFPPKAGVYAVRMGPVLDHNIRQLLLRDEGEFYKADLKEYRPQTSHLSLLATGDGSAIGSKWKLTMRGRWLFRLKVFIDESWQSKFKVGHEARPPGNISSGSSFYSGTACEAVAILFASETLNEDFAVQRSILERMDSDEEFRIAVNSLAGRR
jgi:selenide, water dikinase